MSRLLKYAVVGGLGTLVNEGVVLFTAKLLPLSVSLALAIEVSILFNFILNDLWTFNDKRTGSVWRRLGKFHLSSLSGGVVQYIVVVALLVAVLHFGNLTEILSVLFFSSFVKLQSILLGVINFVGIASGFLVRFLTSVKFVWS
ncbi:MAG: GtrA family protein [Candidatus Aramenus sp.]|nr:GtrA family protein [Candidatus Aramenus sp.]